MKINYICPFFFLPVEEWEVIWNVRSGSAFHFWVLNKFWKEYRKKREINCYQNLYLTTPYPFSPLFPTPRLFCFFPDATIPVFAFLFCIVPWKWDEENCVCLHQSYFLGIFIANCKREGVILCDSWLAGSHAMDGHDLGSHIWVIFGLISAMQNFPVSHGTCKAFFPMVAKLPQFWERHHSLSLRKKKK